MVTTLRTTPVRPAPGAVAEHLAPLLELVFSGAPPVRFESKIHAHQGSRLSGHASV